MRMSLVDRPHTSRTWASRKAVAVRANADPELIAELDQRACLERMTRYIAKHVGRLDDQRVDELIAWVADRSWAVRP